MICLKCQGKITEASKASQSPFELPTLSSGNLKLYAVALVLFGIFACFYSKGLGLLMMLVGLGLLVKGGPAFRIGISLFITLVLLALVYTVEGIREQRGEAGGQIQTGRETKTKGDAAREANKTLQSQTVPLERKLAELNTENAVDDDDITIARFRSLLDQLSDRFPESREKISDMTVKAQALLKKRGITESLLTIMEGINQASLSTQSKGRQYAEYSAAYVSIRNQGLTHKETVDALFNFMSLVPKN